MESYPPKTCLRKKTSTDFKCSECSPDCPLYSSTALGREVLVGVDLEKLAEKMDKNKKFVLFIK